MPHKVRIGGPGSKLPTAVESFLAWSLCLSCLAVSGYHYVMSTYVIPFLFKWRSHGTASVKDGSLSRSKLINDSSDEVRHQPKAWVPLTTHSRDEVDRLSPLERYEQLKTMLNYHRIEYPPKNQEIRSRIELEIINLLREDSICRRLASLSMRPFDTFDTKRKVVNQSGSKLSQASSSHRTILSMQSSSSFMDHSASDDDKYFELAEFLTRNWTELLRLPKFQIEGLEDKHVSNIIARGDSDVADSYLISVIIPSYQESSETLKKQLWKLMSRAVNPTKIEVIIVDAGGRLEQMGSLDKNDSFTSERNNEEKKIEGTDHEVQDGELENVKRVFREFQPERIRRKYSVIESDVPILPFGNFEILDYSEGGGRGPCLNYGASAARGSILTFCHMDTTLPAFWDEKVLATFKNKDSSNNQVVANSCAFAFGIDTSKEGLESSFDPSAKTYFPPGIHAVETTANIRTQLYSLPYGDQAISIPRAIFKFLGGFPDQCLMEDYELVALLRKRAALIQGKPKESLQIIPGIPALCSPRRWQKFGVLYVTYMNSKFVNLYSGGLSPDELYKLYYGQPPPKREKTFAPWEVKMEQLLKSKTKND